MAAEPVPPEIGIVDLSTVVPLAFFRTSPASNYGPGRLAARYSSIGTTRGGLCLVASRGVSHSFSQLLAASRGPSSPRSTSYPFKTHCLQRGVAQSKQKVIPFVVSWPRLDKAHRLMSALSGCSASRYEYDIFNDYLKPYLTRRDVLVTCYDLGVVLCIGEEQAAELRHK